MDLQNVNDNNLKSSIDIARKFNKNHKDVLESIDKILQSNKKLSLDFILSEYKNTRGRVYRCYYLTNNAVNILNTKYTYSAINPRFEFKFETMLREFFPSEKIFTQYKVLNYRIDFFLPDLQMIIEYDEEQHKYSKEKDETRINKIKEKLNQMVINGEPLYEGDTDEPCPWLEEVDLFSVIRIEKGKEIDGIRRLCIEITERTMHPCSDFMEVKNVA